MLREADDALDCLEEAYVGHSELGDHREASLDAHIALAVCLNYADAMARVPTWSARSLMHAPTIDEAESMPPSQAVWWLLGRAGRAAFAPRTAGLVADQTDTLVDSLRRLLNSSEAGLPRQVTHLVLQALVETYSAREQTAELDRFATWEGPPGRVGLALSWGRWLNTLGWAYYSLGRQTEAEMRWMQVSELAEKHRLQDLRISALLNFRRLAIDRMQPEKATELARVLIGVKVGIGKSLLHVRYKEMLASVHLQQHEPTLAQERIDEALYLSNEAEIPFEERGTTLSISSQVLVALGKTPEAANQLQLWAKRSNDRNAYKFSSLALMLRAKMESDVDSDLARKMLSEGLRLARDSKFRSFFLYLPGLAATICRLGLRWEIEVPFVKEVAKLRQLRIEDETYRSDNRMPADKKVFLSYRHTDAGLAHAIFENLTHHGFDVFYDFRSMTSGDFVRVILQNIRSRAHFVVLLTPSALERCNEPNDIFRREIEEAIECRCNIVPLVDGIDLGALETTGQMTGRLALLKQYAAIGLSSEYLGEAMSKLRDRFLNVALEDVLHPGMPPEAGS